MAINKNQTGLNFINLFLPALVFVFSGCAGPKIAADLLAKAKTNETPLKEGTYILNVSINPQINNSERIDESVKQSIDIALAKANIFGADTSKPHRIDANIKRASQAPMSFSSFEGRLEIIYTVTDFTGQVILDKTIYTEAGSDKFIFSGAERHRRARAVNISKNVLQFVEALQNQLQNQ